MRAYADHRLQFPKPGMSLIPQKGQALVAMKPGEAFFTMEPGVVYDVPEWVLKDPVTNNPAPLWTMAFDGGSIHEEVKVATVQVPKDRLPTDEELENAKKIVAMANQDAPEAKPASAKTAPVPDVKADQAKK